MPFNENARRWFSDVSAADTQRIISFHVCLDLSFDNSGTHLN